MKLSVLPIFFTEKSKPNVAEEESQQLHYWGLLLVTKNAPILLADSFKTNTMKK